MATLKEILERTGGNPGYEILRETRVESYLSDFHHWVAVVRFIDGHPVKELERNMDYAILAASIVGSALVSTALEKSNDLEKLNYMFTSGMPDIIQHNIGVRLKRKKN